MEFTVHIFNVMKMFVFTGFNGPLRFSNGRGRIRQASNSKNWQTTKTERYSEDLQQFLPPPSLITLTTSNRLIAHHEQTEKRSC